ncbi:hypothetical protein [Chitinophaga rhizosphaerae]|uniref:hypothetical protein n=1 Tax=Chitinophaga rhizosphaerae TaxID=1864947 RepID=UPI000F803A61|nr:hypothetical protein [Chitinophaga rhizosphaerae]
MKFSFSLCSIAASIFLSALFPGQDAKAQLKLGGNTGIIRGDALLEMESSRKGLLLPRVNATALTKAPLDTAAAGMVIYNTTDNKVYIRSSGTWKPVSDAASTGWNLTGNSTINPALNFLGTTDAQPLIFKTNAIEYGRITETGKMGVGTLYPNSALHVNGSTATNVAVATGNFAMADSNSVVIMNNTADANFALQNPASYKGRAIEVVAYGTANVNFTGYNIRGQNAANPTVALSPGYSLRLVSDGTNWVISGKQRSGLPLYMATTTGAGEGEVVRDYNGYVSKGSGVFQTDVQAAPLNPIPNEGAWFSMMLQTVGGGYFGQFNLNDHNAYFRGNSVSNLGTSVWQKFISHPASIQFAGERVGTDSLNFNMTNNRNIIFSTNNTARVRITGDGTTRLHTGFAANIKLVTSGTYNVDPTDYTIVARVTGGSGAEITINLPDASVTPGRILIIRGMVQGGGAAPDVNIHPSTGDAINLTTGDLSFQPSNSRTSTTSTITLQALDDNNWVIIGR